MKRVTAVVILLASLGGVLPAWAGQGGWYLMVPPIVPPFVEVNGEFGWLRTNAPLRVWKQEAAFDSADACEAGKPKHLKRMTEVASNPEYISGLVAQGVSRADAEKAHDQARASLIAFLWARCVASDDPRLK